MQNQRRRFSEWFERRRGPRDPEDEAALLNVADAFDEVQNSGSLSAEHLRTIVHGASHSPALLWNNATGLLYKLSALYPAAANAIEMMSRDASASVRFAALCSLGPGTPPEITDTVLRRGLIDRSARVRWKAAEQANRLNRHGLVPEIAQALDSEQNPKARRNIELELRMLRDGCWVQPQADNRILVTARKRNGISAASYNEDVFVALGLEAILAKLRWEP